MKIIILLVLLLTSIYSQSAGLSMYAIGDDIKNSDPSSISLGGAHFFSGNLKNISLDSPSSLWRSSLTRFSINTGINRMHNYNIPYQYNHNLTSFSLHFPVGLRKVFGFGLKPLFRTNKIDLNAKSYQFISINKHNSSSSIDFDEPVYTNQMAYLNNYSIDGGISQIFLNYSQKLSQHFSIGMEYSFLFGSQFLENILWTYDVIYSDQSSGIVIDMVSDSTLYALAINQKVNRLNRMRKFSGSLLSLELRWFKNKHEFAVSMSASGKMMVDTKDEIILENSIAEIAQTFSQFTSTTNSFTYKSNSSIYEFGLGYKYDLMDHSGLTIELHKKLPFNIPKEVVLFDIQPPGQNSLHLGYYYQFINNQIGFWNSLNMKYGVYVKELDFSGDYFLDYGITLGIGFEYLANTQSLDVAFRIGERDSRFFEGDSDKYISFNIGLINGEKWFLKRRRK